MDGDSVFIHSAILTHYLYISIYIYIYIYSKFGSIHFQVGACVYRNKSGNVPIAIRVMELCILFLRITPKIVKLTA